MKGMDYIKSKQICWAKRKGLKLFGCEVDKGFPIYVEKIEENLFEPLTVESKQQFETADGGELNDGPTEKAKMKALHSSTAFAVNVFQYWDSINKVHQIAHACRFCNKENKTARKIKFEQKFMIHPMFSPCPNVDIIIENNTESRYKVFAIECKFSEPYSSYKHAGLDGRYIGLPVWDGIKNAYDLAKSISPTDNEFKYLHSAQLIKHILGLKKKYGKSAFRLLYLWYDVHGEEGYLHRKEIERFSEIVKKDGVNFSAISYQKLISNLVNKYYDGNEYYINYLTDRYL